MFRPFELSISKLCERLHLIREYIKTVCFPKDQITSKLARSPLTYNAIIISLYSCYENFVDDILYEYINQIVCNSDSYTELPTDIKTSNLKLSSEFLNSEQRFKNFDLTREEIIENIYSGKVTKKLLLKHSGNLSFSILSDYLKNLGIKDLEIKIKKSQIFIKYFSESKEIEKAKAEDYLKNASAENIFSILNDLILQRNSIAHSWQSDNRIDFEIIITDWIDFIETLCKCLHEIILQCYAKWLVSNDKLFNSEKFEIYSSSLIGFYDTILDCRPNDKIIIKTTNSLKICKITSVKIHTQSKVSIKIDGFKLNKNHSTEYHFYFSKLCATTSAKEIEISNISLNEQEIYF